MVLSPTARWLLRAAALGVLTFIYVPLAVVLLNSFSASATFAWPPPGLTLRWWRVAASNEGVRAAVLTSVQVALLATVIAVVLGTLVSIALVRYESDGTLDAGFDGDGKAIVDLGDGANDVAFDVAAQVDGKFLVAGVVDPQGPTVGGDFLLARFDPDGNLDTKGLDPYLDAPFGTSGKVTTDFGGGYDLAHALAIEPGGKIGCARAGLADDHRISRATGLFDKRPGASRGQPGIDG